ncbi:MAG: hypothetical protein [Siphoviridae sp. ctCJE6]|nr:MAG: hypothetical protein [Siphoviridae sp. ctCJE6]
MRWKKLSDISRDEANEFDELFELWRTLEEGRSVSLARLRHKIEAIMTAMPIDKKKRLTQHWIDRKYLSAEMTRKIGYFNGVIWSLTK